MGDIIFHSHFQRTGYIILLCFTDVLKLYMKKKNKLISTKNHNVYAV